MEANHLNEKLDPKGVKTETKRQAGLLLWGQGIRAGVLGQVINEKINLGHLKRLSNGVTLSGIYISEVYRENVTAVVQQKQFMGDVTTIQTADPWKPYRRGRLSMDDHLTEAPRFVKKDTFSKQGLLNQLEQGGQLY